MPWSAIDGLLARAVGADVGALERHGVHLLAGRRLRRLGRPVPQRLSVLEQEAALRTLAAPALLARIREVCDVPLLLVKGPEAATSWPDPRCRPSVDLDILTADAAGAHRALLAAGFEPLPGASADGTAHHLAPLHRPGLPLAVEIHMHPHWVAWSRPPRFAELLADARPSRTGVPGLLAPSDAHHAMLMAVHGWAHRPLRKLSRLLDVAAQAEGVPPPELSALARNWGIERLWRTTRAAVTHLDGRDETSVALTTWARHLEELRDPTVVETHVERWVAPLWGMPGLRAPAGAVAGLLSDLTPHPTERWTHKRTRVRRALANAAVPEPDHLAGDPI